MTDKFIEENRISGIDLSYYRVGLGVEDVIPVSSLEGHGIYDKSTHCVVPKELQWGWPIVKRIGDMSPNAALQLFRQDDGDIIVQVIGDEFMSESVEFCVPFVGGGRSKNTLEALRSLMLAMEKDNIEFEIPDTTNPMIKEQDSEKN